MSLDTFYVLCVICVWFLCGQWSRKKVSRSKCKSETEYNNIRKVAFWGGIVSFAILIYPK